MMQLWFILRLYRLLYYMAEFITKTFFYFYQQNIQTCILGFHWSAFGFLVEKEFPSIFLRLMGFDYLPSKSFKV